jgi:hypothetical protein
VTSTRRFIARPRAHWCAIAAAALLVSSCAKPAAYQAPVAKFRDASAVVIESTKAYLVALNKTERDHYIDDQVAAGAPIQLIKIDEVQVFGPQAIAARMDALDELANYTELLYQLATSDAPARVKDRATSLGAALTKLSGQVNGLTGADDAGFKRAVSTVFPVVGEVLQAIVEQKVEDALRKAAISGAAPVNTLIEAIKLDSDLAYERKRNALSKRRADAAVAYNAAFTTGGRVETATLRRLANVVSSTEDQWEAFQTARPASGLDAMQRANLALEKLARTPRPGIADFASFVDAVEVFAAAAARVGEGVKQLTALQDRGGR